MEDKAEFFDPRYVNREWRRVGNGTKVNVTFWLKVTVIGYNPNIIEMSISGLVPVERSSN